MAYNEKALFYAPYAGWSIQQKSGAQIVDRTGNGLHGQAYAVLLDTATGIGDGNTAGRFDGTNSWIDIRSAGLSAAFNGAQGSALVWLKVSGAGDWTDGAQRYALRLRVDATNQLFIQKHSVNNTIRFYYLAGGVASTRSATTTGTGWIMAVMTWDKNALPTGEVKCYLNTVQQGATLAGLGVWAGAPVGNYIGAADAAPSTPWKGDLAHIWLYDTVLSQAAINELFITTSPEIAVFGLGHVIPNGAVTPSTEDNTDFGVVTVGNYVDHTFTIRNSGNEPLDLSPWPRIALSGSAQFSLYNDAGTPVAVGEETTFTIRFKPVQAGAPTATVSITNDVVYDNPLTFALAGEGIFGTDYQQRTPPATASYQVKILSTNPGDLLKLYDLQGDTIQSLRYIRRLNGMGTFQFTVPLTAENAALFSTFDRLVEIERYPSLGAPAQIEMTGLTRHVERFVDDEDQGFLIVGGYSLEELLARRVIVPEDDPLMAGGYSTKDGRADDVMAALVLQQASDQASLARRIPGLAVQTGHSAGNNVGLRLRYENLLETLISITSMGAMDFRVERTTGAIFTFIAEVIGQDRTRANNYPGAPFVLLNPELGNMIEPNLTCDRRDEATYIYLQGQGPDEDREVYENQSVRLNDTPYNRIEIASDARQTEEAEITEYLTQAAIELDDHRPQIQFSFALDRAARDYRAVWDLGDKITAQWHGYSQDLRILAVEVEIENEESIAPELGLY